MVAVCAAPVALARQATAVEHILKALAPGFAARQTGWVGVLVAGTSSGGPCRWLQPCHTLPVVQRLSLWVWVVRGSGESACKSLILLALPCENARYCGRLFDALGGNGGIRTLDAGFARILP